MLQRMLELIYTSCCRGLAVDFEPNEEVVLQGGVLQVGGAGGWTFDQNAVHIRSTKHFILEVGGVFAASTQNKRINLERLPAMYLRTITAYDMNNAAMLANPSAHHSRCGDRCCLPGICMGCVDSAP